MDHSEIVEIFAQIDDCEEMNRLFGELLTTKEVADLTLRWQLLKELHAGETQRSIAARHHISLCKITRGSKLLKDNKSIVKNLLDSRLT